ncbi:serine protease 33 [Xenopus laevis]|uniref:Peptidase S1 domain-containing protein n=2 Tax=Xenopus laevis TaxID=8355 RepID=A0A974BVY8_XENLA|nr:serine protease 33 [Xenopus laevis]OCT61948.1 hypothetical protein XELAEV_18047981mg [Xenopus laevis]
MNSFPLLSAVLLLSLGTIGFAEAKDTCGKYISSRIAGGQEAIQGRHPWQVFLWSPGSFRCGGTLISPSLVVSAAQCLKGLAPSSLSVILGAHNLSTYNSEEISIPVKSIIIHPNYTETTLYGDIGLVELTQNVSFTKYIMPVCLPSASISFSPGTNCWVTGWGAMEFNNSKSLSSTLREAAVRLLSDNQCNSLVKVKVNDTICTMDTSGEKRPCQNDTGGPLVCSANNVWYLVGVVSNDNCGDKSIPSVYTYVPAYRDWIATNISTSVSSGSARIGFISGLALKDLSLISFIHSLCCVTLGDLCFVLTISSAFWLR